MIFGLVLLITMVAFFACREKARRIAWQLGGQSQLHSLPHFHGLSAVLVVVSPLLLLGIFWFVCSESLARYLLVQYLSQHSLETTNVVVSQVIGIADGILSATSGNMANAANYYREQTAFLKQVFHAITFGWTLIASIAVWWRINASFKARKVVERITIGFLWGGSLIAIITTLGILLSLLFEAIRFFQLVPLSDFLFGLHWSPQIAIREDQAGASGAFGAVPLFAGTFMITFIAMLVAAPVGLFTAIYLSQYAPAKVRKWVKPILEILAGIPTVVYGYFAALFIAPFIRRLAEGIGLTQTSSESALAAGLVMGMMIIPFVSSLSDDVIRSVPKDLKDAALAMGATQAEAINKVVLPAALPVSPN